VPTNLSWGDSRPSAVLQRTLDKDCKNRKNLLMKLAGSNTLRSSALVLCYSAAEYCAGAPQSGHALLTQVRSMCSWTLPCASFLVPSAKLCTKNYENPSIFVKVIAKKSVAPFFLGHGVYRWDHLRTGTGSVWCYIWTVAGNVCVCNRLLRLFTHCWTMPNRLEWKRVLSSVLSIQCWTGRQNLICGSRIQNRLMYVHFDNVVL